MITLEELKRYLWITDNSEDVLLQEIIDEATAYIQQYNWIIFTQQDYLNKRYNWNWERVFILPNFPLNSISEITYRTNDDFETPEYELIEWKDYTFNENWEIYFRGCEKRSGANCIWWRIITWLSILAVSYQWSRMEYQSE